MEEGQVVAREFLETCCNATERLTSRWHSEEALDALEEVFDEKPLAIEMLVDLTAGAGIGTTRLVAMVGGNDRCAAVLLENLDDK